MASVLYRAAGMPAMQNRLYQSRRDAMAAPAAVLELVQDDSGVVVNQRFDQGLVCYDQSYQNDQGFSPHFRRHLEAVTRYCSAHLSDPHALIVDVGCGKGGFVELLRGQGLNAVGYDNAYQGDSPYIRRSCFDGRSHEQGDLLTLRHVLEHIPSPWPFLVSLAEANGGRGLLYIEVPDLDWILENRAYFDLFHEHVNYFRADDFRRCFGDALIDLSTSFGGQYLSVVLSLERLSHCRPTSWQPELELLGRFGSLVEHESRSYAALNDASSIVLWGAAAKGVVFAAKASPTLQRKMAYAIDINPSKQGHFMPISGLEVLNPVDGMARLSSAIPVVIMNPNYEHEIRDALPPNHPCMLLH